MLVQLPVLILTLKFTHNSTGFGGAIIWSYYLHGFPWLPVQFCCGFELEAWAAFNLSLVDYTTTALFHCLFITTWSAVVRWLCCISGWLKGCCALIKGQRITIQGTVIASWSLLKLLTHQKDKSSLGFEFQYEYGLRKHGPQSFPQSVFILKIKIEWSFTSDNINIFNTLEFK